MGENTAKQQQHIADYYVREKIMLQPTNIQNNPEVRTLAKMMLKSKWRKFGQKSNKTQVGV